jgi:DNA adenine methylase
MQYFGGKGRFYKQINLFLDPITKERPFYDVFVGGLWITFSTTNPSIRIAADANEALITLYQELQRGWIPPDTISKDEYLILKSKNDSKNPLTAFAGFGCSFGGKWFDTYQKSGKRNYALNAKRTLLKQISACKNVQFKHTDYHETFDTSLLGSVLYCDPPYTGCAPYKAVGPFNSDEFWTTVRKFSKTRDIFVSEYSAPEDFNCVWQLEVTSCIAPTKWSSRIEKIFKWNGK